LLLLLFLALAFPAAALAQEYAGTWVARHPNGGTVTLKLEQQGPGEVIGTLEGNGASFEVDAEVRADGLVGMVSGAEAMVYLTGRLSGTTTLQVMLVEPGPGGQPNMQSARQIMFSREGASRPAEKKPQSKQRGPLMASPRQGTRPAQPGRRRSRCIPPS
jgi:hypothetical protein